MAKQLRKPVELARMRSQLEDSTAHLERSDDKIMGNNNIYDHNSTDCQLRSRNTALKNGLG